jgi:arabinan endo-1,5-alpha-L-arabinosidase
VRKALFILWMISLLYGCKSKNGENPASKEIKNPVISSDFPDPAVIRANGKYYAYATQSETSDDTWNIQVASSTDLQNWQLIGDALPGEPVWASNTQEFWAPHVLYDDELKQYVMFYSGESDDTTKGKFIGVAFSSSPEGPFTDKGTPLLEGKGFVNIDPMAIKDPVSNKKLLYWGSGFEPIKVQELSPDYKSFLPGSVAKPVVFPGKEKQYTILVEGAWLDIVNGEYYLYYSGDNCCGDKANYAVMVAKADNPFGPFRRMGETSKNGSSVILEKNKDWLAPGHNSIFRDESGQTWIAYHAIRNSSEGPGGQVRSMCISKLKMVNGWPVVIQ